MAFNLNALKKKINVQTLSESDLIDPKDYISTGNYAVNKIISGSMFKGIPSNRITTFYGESGCVPLTTKVYVIIKATFDTNCVLKSISNAKLFEDFLKRMPIADKINLLCDIGYRITDIARMAKLSRQTMYTLIRNNPIAPQKDRHERSSFSKITNLVRRNIYETEIRNIADFYENDHDFLILTPAGFRNCSNVMDKGEKNSVVLEVHGLEKTAVSDDHLVQLSNGKFDFASNILTAFKNGQFDDEIKTLYGLRKLENAKEGGLIRMCDVEIDDDCHTYYADDLVAHNSGKSLITSEIVKNALIEKHYDAVFYLDSEGGILSERFKKAFEGTDNAEKFNYISVDTVEACDETLSKIYREISDQCDAAGDDEKKRPHVLVVLDSLSGLVAEKFFTDAENGKVAQDMGIEAKLKNKMIKKRMTQVVRTGCPMVVINHSYASMNAMGPQKFQEMSGGKGIGYASHIIVQSTKSKKRQEDVSKGLKAGDSYYSGNAIRYITYKNRLVKEGLEATMYVDLNSGISKYAGLWDDAIRLGFIVQSGAWYTVPKYSDPNKKFRKDDIAENDEIWNLFLKDMDEVFVKETRYSPDEIAENSKKDASEEEDK